MGLDGVEIVMEVEDSFDIAILDDEAAAVETVGQLIDLVRSKLPEREATVCHSAVSFYALRRFLTQVGGSSAADVSEGVRQIIASSVGLSVDQVTPDAHLIKDLGLG